jgi:hypothetical protein
MTSKVMTSAEEKYFSNFGTERNKPKPDFCSKCKKIKNPHTQIYTSLFATFGLISHSEQGRSDKNRSD